MARRLCVTVALVLVAASTARAQVVVIDPGNLVQTILIAIRTGQQYEQLVSQLLTLERMAQGLGNLNRYRIPAVEIRGLDPARWTYGRPWIQGMTTGDPGGELYLASALPLEPMADVLPQVPAAARTAFERRYATVEITDSVATLGGHQTAILRDYGGLIQQAIQSLEGDVLSNRAGYHDVTAILDKIAAGELVARRQDMAANQLLSHVLEQLLARSKRQRDTEAETLNMQLVTWRDGQALNDAFVAGTGDALRTWKQR
jgi:hypothetical protein